MDKATCEVWLLVDDNGDYAVAPSSEAAIEDYESNTQALTEAGGFRLVKLTLTVPKPAIVELTGDVPATDGPVELTVAN